MLRGGRDADIALYAHDQAGEPIRLTRAEGPKRPNIVSE